MSVRASERGQGKLEAIVIARELATYTIRVTDNPKNFDPVHRPFIDKMQSAATDIFVRANAANCIYVKSRTEADSRFRLQCEAISKCYEFLGLLNIAHGLFHIDGKRTKYWGNLTIATRDKIKAWRDSDVKRYKDL